jgi:hypothetical protein
MKENVKVSTDTLNRIREYVKKTRQTVGGFYDLAAEEKLRRDINHSSFYNTDSNGKFPPTSKISQKIKSSRKSPKP